MYCKNNNVVLLLSEKVCCSNTKCVVIIVEVPVKSQQQQQQQEGDGLSAFISVYSQPARIYLTTQAHRREIKSKGKLIASANIQAVRLQQNKTQ